MKKYAKLLILFMTAAMICGMLAACGDDGQEPKEIQTFAQFIDNGDVAGAVQYYQSDLAGDSTLAQAGQEKIVSLCNDVADGVLSGSCTVNEAKLKVEVLQEVSRGVSMTVDGFDVAVECVTIAISSKAAYTVASELEAQNDCVGAIEQYSLVVEGDANYSDAQTAIERCENVIKQDAMDAADVAASSGDHKKAVLILKDAAAHLPQDTELLTALESYESAYVQSVLSETEKVFENPVTDYEAALSLVNDALESCTDNSTLMEKKAYFASFAPVNLYDLEPVNGAASTMETDTDTGGTTFEKCFWAGYSSLKWSETDVTFDLSGVYNTFTATVYGRSAKSTAQYMNVYIYGDGELLYEEQRIADNDTEAFEITVDITGVSELRITLDRDNGAIGKGIGMTEIFVQRTEE